MAHSVAAKPKVVSEQNAYAALRLEVDQHVGKRIRLRRIMLRMTQEQLGERLAVSYEQVQQYERGESVLAPSRLLELCHIMNVPITYFFEELLPEDAMTGGEHGINQVANSNPD